MSSKVKALVSFVASGIHLPESEPCALVVAGSQSEIFMIDGIKTAAKPGGPYDE